MSYESRPIMKYFFSFIISVSFITLSCPIQPAEANYQPIIIKSSRHDISPPLQLSTKDARSSVIQDWQNPWTMPGTIRNFEGISNVNKRYPPDTQGDVGPNHYVQVVNIAFAIFDKEGNKLYGPANLNTLFNGFGGPCETTNDGDPMRPKQRGAVLTNLKRFTHGILNSHDTTTPTTLKDEQEIFYIDSGVGVIKAGNKTES